MNDIENKISPTAGLYIHIPFCKSKCPYCGFYSVASTVLIPRWLDALNKEVPIYKDRFDSFDTLYMGGGTPSLLDLRDMENLMDGLFSHFHFTSDAEITLEANPGLMTNEKIAGIKSLGFNRINLGVQSFDDQELRFLGRSHNARDAERTLTNLRSYGFNNIGIDLIYGLENQSIKKWNDTLTSALRFNPEHISCYQLTIEDKTPFRRMKDQGRLKTPDEKGECHFFITSSERLEANGYIHYEISNFAKNKTFYSHHNCKYWNHTSYLGLGPSAHSFHNKKRWWNVRSIRQYCEALEQGEAPVEGIENLTNKQIQLETIFLGLRTRKGINIQDFKGIPTIDKALSQLLDSGHIRIQNNRVIATKKGFLVADRLPLYFV